jgi:TPR repeat
MVTLVGAQEAAPRARHLGTTNRDATMACVQDLHGKPALWDRVDAGFLIQPCPATRQELTEALSKRGMRLFDAKDFMFVTPEKLFHPFGAPEELYPGGPLQAWQALRWTTITVHLQVQKLRDNQDLPAHADELARQILEQARMIPLAVSQGPPDGFPNKGSVDAELNIALWQGNLGPRDEQTVLACVNARGRTTFATARLVYGVLRDGQYVMLWDSPLFNVLHGDISFRDLHADGNQEVVIKSTNWGNKEYPMLVIFDRNGREITRQKKCDTTIAADANFTAEDGTCAIFGTDVQFSSDTRMPRDPDDQSAVPPEEIYVSEWYGDGKNHVFKLNKEGSYVPGAPMLGPFPPEPLPPPTPDPAQLNQQGIKFMRAKDYATAEGKFMQASILVGDKNPEYANNLGFAFYKLEKYDFAVYWLKKAIELDPKRSVAYLNLGDAYVALKRNAEACEAYKKYLELAPDSKAAPDVKKKLDGLPPTP